MLNKKKNSRIAAVLILIMATVAFGSMTAASQLTIGQQPNALLFHVGITCEALVFVLEIVISVLLYRLFEAADKTLSMIAALSRIAMAVIQGVNVIIHLLAFNIISSSSIEMGKEQIDMWTSLLQDAHAYGVCVWQLFFVLHLILFGYVAYKSNYIPKFVSVCVSVASIGYLAESIVKIWGVEHEVTRLIVTVLLIISTLGELIFTFWLLIKGINNSSEKHTCA